MGVTKPPFFFVGFYSLSPQDETYTWYHYSAKSLWPGKQKRPSTYDYDFDKWIEY